jgi:anti-sigma factor RsiW
MGLTHRLHILGKQGERLAAYAAGELPVAERPRLEARLATCRFCRRDVESYRRVSAALREKPRVRLSAEEAAAFLPGVNRRIDQGRVGAQRGARPGLRELFWDHPRLSLASAITAVLLVAGLTLSQLQLWGTTGVNGVDVVSVDVDEDASVLVFQIPGTALKVIWVFDDTSS